MRHPILKKISLIVIAIAFIATGYTYLYKKFQTKTIALESRKIDQVIQNKVEVESLAGYLKQHEEGKMVLLINDDSADSEYLINTILTPLANEQEEQALPQITEVHVPIDTNISVTRLKNLLQIDRYPAFVFLECKNGKYEIIDTLTYDPNKPFKIDELKTWFFNNKLWNGPYGTKE